ncbi:hypothetical protein Trydic_g15043 [Trypoxylus dichotomus]
MDEILQQLTFQQFFGHRILVKEHNPNLQTLRNSSWAPTMSNSQVSSGRLFLPNQMSNSSLEIVTEASPMEESSAKAKTYPTSVTQLSALLVQAHKGSLGDCSAQDTPSTFPAPTSSEGSVTTALRKTHTCGSLFAKCGCNNETNSTPLLQTFSHPIVKETETPRKRSSNPSISSNYNGVTRAFPKRLSNPEINEQPEIAGQKSSKSVIKPINGCLKHPDIPYPIEIPKESRSCDVKPQRRSVSFSNNQQVDRAALADKRKEEENLKYHKYNALSYGNYDTSDPAHKFFKEFGIFGPMGGELSSIIRKNSNISTANDPNNCHSGKTSPKFMCLDPNRRKESQQQEDQEYTKIRLMRLERDLSEAKRQIEVLKNELTVSEAEVLKLQRENHKLKSVLQQTTSVAYKDGDLLTRLQEQHAMANSSQQTHQTTANSMILKKQGVSAESSDLSGQFNDIRIVKHEKDFRSKQLIKDAILDNDFLKHLNSSQVRELVDSMYPKEFPAGTYVIREGDAGAHLFVSAEGDFEVRKDDNVLGNMGPGKAFGELAILYNCTRTASIRVVTDSRVWVLDRKIFQQIMVRTGMQRLQDNVNFLRSVPLLQNLRDEVLSKIADVLEVEMYPAGTYIIRQGATGDTFFIICSGKVKITQRIPGIPEEQEIRTLERGDYFGEQALLKEDFRTASVIALHPGVECLTLDRDSFIQLIGDLSEIKEKKYEDEKRALTRPVSSSNFASISEYDYINLNDLDVIATLGVGGFGRVELVQYSQDSTLTFALKCLKKQHIVDTQQQEHIFSEKHIMMSCKSPFICRLYRTYRDTKYVYMLLEACLGGEVWTILRDRGSFDDHTTRFITACVVEAFEYLHSRGIIYRDLKPENLLLDAKGYVKLVDFGFSKRLGYSSKTWTFCGTPEYVAPETILNKGHDRAVDYWALGILMHELLSGNPPFSASDPMKTYNLILKGIDMIDFASYNISRSAQSLIKKLCRDAPSERLGYQRGGIQDIKKHKWFQSFDWDGLRAQTLQAPIVQRINTAINRNLILGVFMAGDKKCVYDPIRGLDYR